MSKEHPYINANLISVTEASASTGALGILPVANHPAIHSLGNHAHFHRRPPLHGSTSSVHSAKSVNARPTLSDWRQRLEVAGVHLHLDGAPKYLERKHERSRAVLALHIALETHERTCPDPDVFAD